MCRAPTYHDLEGLGGQADGALGAEVLVLGALDELLADLLEGLHLARGQGDACGRSSVGAVLTGARGFGPRTDLVDLGGLAELLLGLVVRHLDGLISGCPSRLERGGLLGRVRDCHVVVPCASLCIKHDREGHRAIRRGSLPVRQSDEGEDACAGLFGGEFPIANFLPFSPIFCDSGRWGEAWRGHG